MHVSGMDQERRRAKPDLARRRPYDSRRFTMTQNPMTMDIAGSPALRPASAADIDAVVALGNDIHQDHQEQPAVFHNRFTLFPQGIWLAEDADGTLLAYAVSHPLGLHASVPLDTILPGPLAREVLYIHDVAVSPRARGLNLGQRLLGRLEQVAVTEDLPLLALTALDGLAPYWARFGFSEVTVPALAAKLASYGAGAAYMVKALRS